MLILHIMASRALGGAETYSTDVILSLQRAGIRQCVVMAKDAPRYQELKDAGITLAPGVLAVPFRPLQKLLLRRLLKKMQPDIVHCWLRRAAGIVSPAESQRRPVIGWFGGYYDPRHFKSCSQFVGVTQDIVAHMIKNGVAPANAAFIPTFPDIAPLPPVDRSQFATPKEARILLTLSRLHPKKGLDSLLTALRDLPECYLWMAGDGPLRRTLENQAGTLGVIDRVRFLGWRTDRAALLRAADICLLPSRYEPFGTVILEAWAAGTPLIACNSAGPAAHIRDGDNGLLVPVDDAAGLAQAVRQLLQDEDLRRRLVAQGFATYTQSYTREAVTQQWLALYRRLRTARAPDTTQ